MLVVLDRNAYLSKFIHKVNGKDGVEPVLMDGFPMILWIHACAWISCAAFHDGTVHFLHKLTDKWWLQVMGVATLTSGYFDRHTTRSLHVKCLIYFKQRLRCDLLSKIHLGLSQYSTCYCHQGHCQNYSHISHTKFMLIYLSIILNKILHKLRVTEVDEARILLVEGGNLRQIIL